jgi:PIN domain nuclease of toxin-antitoxin system
MLAAQSVAEACTIATPDPLIRQYPVSAIWQREGNTAGLAVF